MGRDPEGFLVVSDYDFCFMSDGHQDLSSANAVTDDGVHADDFGHSLESEVDSYTQKLNVIYARGKRIEIQT